MKLSQFLVSLFIFLTLALGHTKVDNEASPIEHSEVNQKPVQKLDSKAKAEPPHAKPQNSQKVTETAEPEDLEESDESEPNAEVEANTPAVVRKSFEEKLRQLIARNKTLKDQVTQEKLTFSTLWNQKLQIYRDYNEKLNDISDYFDEDKDLTFEAKTTFREICEIWRKLVDISNETVTETSNFRPLKTLPRDPADLIEATQNTKLGQTYKSSLAALKEERSRFLDQTTQTAQELLNTHYATLLRAGRLRSQTLVRGINQGELSSFEWDDAYFADVYREFVITPYRWIAIGYSKFVQFRTDLNSGVRGYYHLFKTLVALLLFFAAIFTFFWCLKKIPSSMKRLREKLIRKSRKAPWAASAALWVERSRPFLPWLLLLVACSLCRSLLRGTYFFEFSIFIPYLAIYAYYRIFRTLFESGLSRLTLIADRRRTEDVRERIHKAAHFLGRFLLISIWIIYTVESAVSRGYIYLNLKSAVTVVAILILIRLVLQWKQEIAKAIEKQLDSNFGRYIARQCLGTFGVVWCIPAGMLAVLLIVGNYLLEWSERFEVFRKISAQLFKKRIETSTQIDASTEIVSDPEYLALFDGPISEGSERPELHKKAKEKMLSAIDLWAQFQDQEGTLALVGEKGLGKTFLIEELSEEVVKKGFKVFYEEVEGKLSTRKKVEEFFTSKIKSLTNEDDQNTRWVIFIDNAHDLFLSKIGGFEGYRAFLEMMESSPLNLFWCLTFDQKSWNYLSAASGRARYFGEIVQMEEIDEIQTRELIMSRHNLSKFKLSFASILNAAKVDYDVDGLSYVENRFFTLLWEESHGNPKVVLKLWPTCLAQMNKTSLKVGLPKKRQENLLSSLNDDTLFVYATLVRHENLTFRELQVVSNTSKDVIRNAIRIGMQKNFITLNDEKRYQVQPLWQHRLYSILGRKQFIYGK